MSMVDAAKTSKMLIGCANLEKFKMMNDEKNQFNGLDLMHLRSQQNLGVLTIVSFLSMLKGHNMQGINLNAGAKL